MNNNEKNILEQQLNTIYKLMDQVDSNFIAYRDIKVAINQLRIEVELRPDLKIVK